MASGQAGQSYGYLDERLGEKRFQELCGALLAHSFPDVTCYPVGQSDGGRDIVRKRDGRAFVHQVKWTSKQLQVNEPTRRPGQPLCHVRGSGI
jgi:hypothetical protein